MSVSRKIFISPQFLKRYSLAAEVLISPSKLGYTYIRTPEAVSLLLFFIFLKISFLSLFAPKAATLHIWNAVTKTALMTLCALLSVSSGLLQWVFSSWVVLFCSSVCLINSDWIFTCLLAAGYFHIPISILEFCSATQVTWDLFRSCFSDGLAGTIAAGSLGVFFLTSEARLF